MILPITWEDWKMLTFSDQFLKIRLATVAVLLSDETRAKHLIQLSGESKCDKFETMPAYTAVWCVVDVIRRELIGKKAAIELFEIREEEKKMRFQEINERWTTTRRHRLLHWSKHAVEMHFVCLCLCRLFLRSFVYLYFLYIFFQLWNVFQIADEIRNNFHCNTNIC